MLGGCDPCEYQAWIERQRRELIAAAPEFADPARARELQSKIYRLLGDYGFTAKEIGRVDDARVVLLLRDIILEDQLGIGK